MRLMKALATEGAYLILAMAEALDRSTYVYIQDIYESKSDTGPSRCLGLHSKSSMPAGPQECVPHNFWPFLDTSKGWAYLRKRVIVDFGFRPLNSFRDSGSIENIWSAKIVEQTADRFSSHNQQHSSSTEHG